MQNSLKEKNSNQVHNQDSRKIDEIHQRVRFREMQFQKMLTVIYPDYFSQFTQWQKLEVN